MNRRTFTQQLAGTVVGACALGHASDWANSQSTSPPNPSDVSGAPFKVSIMLWTVFTNLPFEQRLEKVAEAGYRNVELVGEYSKWTEDDFTRNNAMRKELGITFDCTAGIKHGVGNPEHRAALLAELTQTLPTMERLDCPSMILLSGNRIPGTPREVQHQSCIDTLKAAAKIVEGKSINGEPVRLLLETIDPEENPQYYLTQIAEALEVVQAVDHPQVRLLYDFYHEQIAAGNLIEKLQKSIPYLGLVHIADVPGRHEPGTGEINYQNIFAKLAELNYKGIAAMEFHPTGDPVSQLRAAREMALQAGREGLSKAANRRS
ncbi:MAG: TIM barrel protein [Candidatus Sulfotelmatobacter sp.]